MPDTLHDLDSLLEYLHKIRDNLGNIGLGQGRNADGVRVQELAIFNCPGMQSNDRLIFTKDDVKMLLEITPVEWDEEAWAKQWELLKHLQKKSRDKLVPKTEWMQQAKTQWQARKELLEVIKQARMVVSFFPVNQ